MQRQVHIYHGHHIPQAQGVCVVIDVLRAFTTAAFAFGNGVREIFFVASPQDAFGLRQVDPLLLLMGEQDGIRIEGFDFGNSPREIQRASLKGATMVQRTSSGTQGIVGCSHVPHMYAASFVNAEATLKNVLKHDSSHVSLIVTGRNNGDEDLALAEYLKARLENKPFDIKALLNRVKSAPAALRMLEAKTGYEDGPEDIELAMKTDLFPFAIKVFKENDRLIGRPIYI